MTNGRKTKVEIDYPVWLSTDEAARYLGLVDASVKRLVSSGDLPAYRIGRVFRYRLEDVQAVMEGARVVPKEMEL